MRRTLLALAMVLSVGVVAGCGSSSSSGGTTRTPSTGFFISISSFNFSPVNLAAPPGATITVINDDGAPHSVTSENAPETYTPGGVAGVSFDTGAFTGQATFTLPSGIADGTVIPYYCSVHRDMMATKTGTITIQASAQPTSAPGSSTTGSGSGY